MNIRFHALLKEYRKPMAITAFFAVLLWISLNFLRLAWIGFGAENYEHYQLTRMHDSLRIDPTWDAAKSYISQNIKTGMTREQVYRIYWNVGSFSNSTHRGICSQTHPQEVPVENIYLWGPSGSIQQFLCFDDSGQLIEIMPVKGSE
jgi:hypothetical protein